MASEIDAFERRGVALVAISVDSHEDSQRLSQKLDVSYPLLRDSDLRVATAYGVGQEEQALALPATVLVLPDQTVFHRQVGETAADRLDVDDLLAIIDRALETAEAERVP